MGWTRTLIMLIATAAWLVACRPEVAASVAPAAIPAEASSPPTAPKQKSSRTTASTAAANGFEKLSREIERLREVLDEQVNKHTEFVDKYEEQQSANARFTRELVEQVTDSESKAKAAQDAWRRAENSYDEFLQGIVDRGTVGGNPFAPGRRPK